VSDSRPGRQPERSQPDPRVTELFVHHAGDVIVIEPHGMLFGGGETRALETAMQRSLDARPRAIILDLWATKHVDSRTIGVLLSMHRKAGERGIGLLLCNLNQRILHTLAVVKVTGILQIHTTRAQCLEAIEFGTST
jgi:anti-anti-sigma factor